MRRWIRPNGPGERYLIVSSTEVVVGSHWATGHSDNAGSCSLDAFREGRFHSLIREQFDQAVLDEALALVGQAPTRHTASAAEIAAIKALVASLDSGAERGEVAAELIAQVAVHRLRKHALKALRRIGATGPEVVQAAAGALADRRPAVFKAACRLLATQGQAAEGALVALAAGFEVSPITREASLLELLASPDIVDHKAEFLQQLAAGQHPAAGRLARGMLSWLERPAPDPVPSTE